MRFSWTDPGDNEEMISMKFIDAPARVVLILRPIRSLVRVFGHFPFVVGGVKK
jgi:hypothetical protein